MDWFDKASSFEKKSVVLYPGLVRNLPEAPPLLALHEIISLGLAHGVYFLIHWLPPCLFS
jgi:hypothetical protein